MVPLEARFVSGHAFQACRHWQVECAGFSRCAGTGKPRRLKPFRTVAFGGIAEQAAEKVALQAEGNLSG